MRYRWTPLYLLAISLMLGAKICCPALKVHASSPSPEGQHNSVISQNSAESSETLPDLYDDQELKTYLDMLKLAREMDERQLEGMALVSVGTIYLFQEKFSLALEHLEPGLKIAEDFKDRVSEKRALNSLVATYLNLGNYDETIVAAKRLLAIGQEEKNLGLSATALQGLGSAEANRGNFKKAILYHERALQLARQIKDPEREAIILTALGETYLQAGQPDKSIEFIEQGKAIQEKLLQSGGNQPLTIQASDTWGTVVTKALTLRKRGQTEQAITAFARYGEMFSETDSTAVQYSQVAQQFTRQLSVLGFEGGAYIYEVLEGDAAANAGLAVGDIVIAYNDQPIEGMDDLEAVLGAAPKGKRLPITYLRLEANRQFRKYQTMVINPIGARLMPI